MPKFIEYEKRFDPELGRHVRKHVHGEGFREIFSNMGKKLFGETEKTFKSRNSKRNRKGDRKIRKKASNFAAKKASDKIVSLLNHKTPQLWFEIPFTQPMTEYERRQRVNQLLSGSGTRSRKPRRL